MNETHKLINFRELSRRLEMNERRLGADRIPKKHKEAFKDLYAFLERFVYRVNNNVVTHRVAGREVIKADYKIFDPFD